MVRITHARRVGVVNTMNGRTNVTGGGSNGSLGGVIPLEAPSNFTVTPDNGKCLLTWTDPKDKYADEVGEITDEGDQLVSQFAYTRIVRKTTGYPSGPNDGDIVTESSTRNQYQSTAYSDEGLVINTLYYYAAFTCNTDGVWSGSITGSGTPKSYDPILANNTWEQINEVANEGIASSVWNIGDEIDIQVLSETVTACIIDFDHDTLSDKSGTAAITFGLKNMPSHTHMFDDDNSQSSVNWYNSDQYKWYNSTLIPSIDTNLISFLQTVPKRAISVGGHNYGDADAIVTNRSQNVKIFPFACIEVNLRTGYSLAHDQQEGTLYPYFASNSNRVKYLNDGTPKGWNLRTCEEYDQANSGGLYITHVYYVNQGGSLSAEQFIRSIVYGICFGFCIGKTPS